MKELKIQAMLVLIQAGWQSDKIARVLMLSRATVERKVIELHRNKVAEHFETLREKMRKGL